MVNHDSSPSSRLPAHCFQCKCSPFVSVDQMSQRLLCWSASLLIRSEQRVQSFERALPALSLYLHRLWVHTSMENPPYQTFFARSRNIFIVEHSYVAQPITANLFYSSHVHSILYQKMDTIYMSCFTLKQAVKLTFFHCHSIKRL